MRHTIFLAGCASALLVTGGCEDPAVPTNGGVLGTTGGSSRTLPDAGPSTFGTTGDPRGSQMTTGIPNTGGDPGPVAEAGAVTEGGSVIEAGPVPDSGAPDADLTGDGQPPGDPAAVRCSAKPGGRRGKHEERMTVAGLDRSFVYYAPDSLDPDQPVPLVIVPHGTNMSGEGMYSITEYAKLADREGFVVIFPDGGSGPGSLAPWNVGSGVCGLGAFVGSSGDDQAFVDALIAFAQEDQCIDEEHVFMTGFSMGGYFSNESACLNPKISGIAPHSAGTHDLSGCRNERMPVMVFHFEADSLIGYDCGIQARDEWIARNGCSQENPDVVQVEGGRCEYFKDCPPDGQVAMCSFTEGAGEALPTGHGWSGGAKGGREDFAAITATESATELGWRFFEEYAW